MTSIAVAGILLIVATVQCDVIPDLVTQQELNTELFSHIHQVYREYGDRLSQILLPSSESSIVFSPFGVNAWLSYIYLCSHDNVEREINKIFQFGKYSNYDIVIVRKNITETLRSSGIFDKFENAQAPIYYDNPERNESITKFNHEISVDVKCELPSLSNRYYSVRNISLMHIKAQLLTVDDAEIYPPLIKIRCMNGAIMFLLFKNDASSETIDFDPNISEFLYQQTQNATQLEDIELIIDEFGISMPLDLRSLNAKFPQMGLDNLFANNTIIGSFGLDDVKLKSNFIAVSSIISDNSTMSTLQTIVADSSYIFLVYTADMETLIMSGHIINK